VNFYASTDPIIGTADYLIGCVYVSGGVAGGSYVDVDWQEPFPSSVPLGTYWVGWIIDSEDDVTETDETNNKAYQSSYQLNVWPRVLVNPDTIIVSVGSEFSIDIDIQNVNHLWQLDVLASFDRNISFCLLGFSKRI